MNRKRQRENQGGPKSSKDISQATPKPYRVVVVLSLLPALLVTLGFVCITALADEVTAGPGPDGGAVELTGEALLAMADADNVISLNGNYTLTETVLIEDRTLTIRGTEGTRITGENIGMMLWLTNSTLKLENITLDVQGGTALRLDLSVYDLGRGKRPGRICRPRQPVYDERRRNFQHRL